VWIFYFQLFFSFIENFEEISDVWRRELALLEQKALSQAPGMLCQ